MPGIGTREDVVADARKWLGSMYKWGGEDESEGGVDCSGLIIDALKDSGFGMLVPGRPIASQFGTMGREITLDQAQPADVLYFDNPGPTDHVALYVGGGMMIEAPTVGQQVRLTPVRTPTSVRNIIGGGLGSRDPRSAGEQWLDDTVGEWISDWGGDAMKLGMYAVGALLAGALVVGGVMNTVKKG